MKKIIIILMSIMMLLGVSACSNGNSSTPNEAANEEKNANIILATTTSTKDSGLLDAILDDFTKKTGYTVDVISVGSGEAMKMGENGEADVLLVHSPKAEKEYVENGHADENGRADVMYNDFVIIGPKDDPANISKDASDDAIKAFEIIANTNTSFISRADESGTHKKELSIWDKLEMTPSGEWYIEAATGMGAVISMANEKLAYTLSDRATWLNLGKDTDLEILSQKDPSGILNNQYGVIVVNPDKNDKINHEGALAFREWILSEETQNLIGEYGKDTYGAPLFVPNAK